MEDFSLVGTKGEYSQNGINYFVERARGNFGLIVTGSNVADLTVDPFEPINGNPNPTYAQAYFGHSARTMLERVHAYGSKMFLQISMGPGRMRDGKTPSAVPSYKDPSVLTEELTKEEIETKIEAMINIAQFAQTCGYDGVEIHGMHWGYLLDQFAMSVHNVSMFMIGRFIQGLACGLASSTITAYIVDNAPVSPVWLGATVTGVTPNIGLVVGSYGSAALNQLASGSLTLIYIVLFGTLIICTVLIAASQETVNYSKGAIGSILPRVSIPKNIRYLLPAASAVFIGGWAVGGFYQAFSSSIAAEQLGSKNTIAAALVFASFMASYAVGGYLIGRLKPRTAQRFSMSAYFLSMIAVLASLRIGAITPFLFASIFAGASQGAAFTGSMRGLLEKTTQKDRAGVLSTIYIISYSGAAIPNLIVGRIANLFTVFEIAVGYGILVAFAFILTLFLSRVRQD